MVESFKYFRSIGKSKNEAYRLARIDVISLKIDVRTWNSWFTGISFRSPFFAK